MKRSDLLQATRELEEQYEAGHLTLEEYQAARLLLSSQFDTLPSFMNGMPGPPSTRPTKHSAKTAPYPAFSQPDSKRQSLIAQEFADTHSTPALSPSHLLLSPPPSRHPTLPPSQQARKQTPPPQQTEPDLLGELLAALKDLNQLHKLGILSEAEFHTTKAPILERIRTNFANQMGDEKEQSLPPALLALLAE